MSDIGRRVFRERTRRGWNQSDLARRAGVSASWVSRLERGEHERPSNVMLQKVADALRIPIMRLLDDTRPMEPEMREKIEEFLSSSSTSVSFAHTMDTLDLSSWTEADLELLWRTIQVAVDLKQQQQPD